MIRHRRWVQIVSLVALLLGMGVPFGTARAQTNQPAGYLPVTAYVRRSDSPFAGMANLRLEDFEDHQFNLLGVTASAGQVTRVQYPDPNLTSVDSVDLDDGAQDGSGTRGDSFVAGADAGITLTFNPAVIGAYPTHVGLVWTDGSYATTFEAYNASGASMGVLGPISHADGSWYGTTGEDRFYGVVNAGGISKVTIRNPGSPNEIEIDHIQYAGLTNMPPRGATPKLPANPSLLTSKLVRFEWIDKGDSDNFPKPYRTFQLELWPSGGSSTWVANISRATHTVIPVPGDGTYLWRVRSNDGELWSLWSPTQTFSVAADGLHSETRLRAVQDGAATTAIYFKMCGVGQRQRVYVKDLTPGRPGWNATYGALNGCSAETAGVVQAVPGDRFTFYSTVSNSQLSESDFMARAKRSSCTVMAVGRMACREGDVAPTYNPPPQPTTGFVLDTVYVDQVYAQRWREGAYWNWCGPSSVSMLLNYYADAATRAQFDERATTAALVGKVKAGGVGLSNWSMIHTAIREAGHEIITGGTISEEELAASLRAGNPVIIGFGPPVGHITLATGIAADGKYLINDPFGGAWMPTWEAGDLTNVTYSAAQGLPEDVPERTGRGVAYTYQQLIDLGMWQYVRVARPQPETSRSVKPGTPENSPQSSLMPTAPVLASRDMEAIFAPSDGGLTISYENHIVPSAGLEGSASRLAAIRFSATNAAGQPVTAAAPFSLRINLDPATVDALGLTEAGPSTAAPPELALMRRNPATGQWLRVQNVTVDKASYLVTAQVDSFTEYAVVPLAVAGAPLPTVSMASTSVSVEERAGVANVEIKLSAPMNQVVRVNYEAFSYAGDAQVGSDYPATNASVFFLPGETSKTVPIAIVDDTIAEPAEIFRVRINSASGITLGSQLQTNIIILINDGLVFVPSVYDVYEGLSVQLTLRLTGPSNGTVTVKYATRGGTARSLSDYVATSGTLSFAPGETLKTITVQTVSNSTHEPEESFWVDLSVAAGSGAQMVGPSSAQIIIEDGCDPTLC